MKWNEKRRKWNIIQTTDNEFTNEHLKENKQTNKQQQQEQQLNIKMRHIHPYTNGIRFFVYVFGRVSFFPFFKFFFFFFVFLCMY